MYKMVDKILIADYTSRKNFCAFKIIEREKVMP